MAYLIRGLHSSQRHSIEWIFTLKSAYSIPSHTILQNQLRSLFPLRLKKHYYASTNLNILSSPQFINSLQNRITCLLVSKCISPDIEIAFVFPDKLGDSLIFLLFVENFQLNSIKCVCYSDVLYQIRLWIPHLKVLPSLNNKNLREKTRKYPLVVFHEASKLFKTLSVGEIDELAKNSFFLNYGSSSTEKLNLKNSVKKLPGLILPASGSVRKFKAFTKENMAEVTEDFLRSQLGFSSTKSEIKLSPPKDLILGKYKNRIILSPDSKNKNPNRNWPEKYFIKLAKKLTAMGFDISLIVDPSNWSYWSGKYGEIFSVPKFESIDSLSAFIYESKAIVANDSGNGHLASALGIPVITIYSKQNKLFRWRPAWGNCFVVTPRHIIKLPFVGEVWAPFISMREIINLLNLT